MQEQQVVMAYYLYLACFGTTIWPTIRTEYNTNGIFSIVLVNTATNSIPSSTQHLFVITHLLWSVSSRPSVPPSQSLNCLRFGHSLPDTVHYKEFYSLTYLLYSVTHFVTPHKCDMYVHEILNVVGILLLLLLQSAPSRCRERVDVLVKMMRPNFALTITIKSLIIVVIIASLLLQLFIWSTFHSTGRSSNVSWAGVHFHDYCLKFHRQTME